MIADELISTEHRLGAHNYKPLDVILSRGEGVWVWDVDGKRYLDCLSAYSAVNQGHCHPKILAAMVEQAKKLTLTSRAFRNDQLALFYEEIAALTGSHKVLPMNSGAEAVESAVKAVRKWGYEVKGVPEGKAEIIVAADNFHGRTMGDRRLLDRSRTRAAVSARSRRASSSCRSATSRPSRRRSRRTPSPSWSSRSRARRASIIPPAGYFPRVRELCTKNNVTLILDEIQTGLGRTGKLLAEQHEGIEADVTLVGKALSGGFYPVSAVLSNSEVLGVLQARPARLDLRRQPARLRDRARGAQGADRGGHDRELGRDGRLFHGRPEVDPLQHRQGGARPRPDARRRAQPGSRRRPQILPCAEGSRPARQGHARPHHPHRPAAGRQEGRDRLGAGRVRPGVDQGNLSH